jgi:molecular chaperone GrpE (heat shock protein)
VKVPLWWMQAASKATRAPRKVMTPASAMTLDVGQSHGAQASLLTESCSVFRDAAQDHHLVHSFRRTTQEVRETAMPHIFEDVAAEPADVPTLVAENASLRDRLLRALAETENTRRQAERAAADVRQYAVSDFARQLLTVLDNLHRTIAAAEHGRFKLRRECGAA